MKFSSQQITGHREICQKLQRERPKWVKGSLSDSDTAFLFRQAVGAHTGLLVEIGTASGFSTAVLCHALQNAEQSGSIGPQFQVVSYDISPTFYADPTKRVGDAAREQLTPELLAHIDFRHPLLAADLSSYHRPDEIEFLFIDANHKHPWPTLDLLASLDCLRGGATVLLHDINLPIIHPEFAAWGVKYLFDELDLEKEVPTDVAIPNIGRITIPEDKQALKQQLLQILAAHPAEAQVPEAYMKRLGLEEVEHG